MRLLLVEDDFLIASASEAALRAAGHEIVGMAGASASALVLAQARQPDLCIVDVNLADGATGVSFVLEAYRRCGVRSLFATSDEAGCRAAWPAALGCIGKPYAMDELVRAVGACGALLQGGAVADKPAALNLFGG